MPQTRRRVKTRAVATSSLTASPVSSPSSSSPFPCLYRHVAVFQDQEETYAEAHEGKGQPGTKNFYGKRS